MTKTRDAKAGAFRPRIARRARRLPLQIRRIPANVRLSFLNVLNTTYIVNAQNNDATGEWYYRDEVTRYPIFENNFDAASSAVYMGYGARTNVT